MRAQAALNASRCVGQSFCMQAAAAGHWHASAIEYEWLRLSMYVSGPFVVTRKRGQVEHQHCVTENEIITLKLSVAMSL
jgi:hypothetical protein